MYEIGTGCNLRVAPFSRLYGDEMIPRVHGDLVVELRYQFSIERIHRNTDPCVFISPNHELTLRREIARVIGKELDTERCFEGGL